MSWRMTKEKPRQGFYSCIGFIGFIGVMECLLAL
nr:MAG TPA: hypothetical protein [Caudoviricetes sp.]